MSEADTVVFLASFPDIQGAIRVGRDGARIVLEIPETEMPSIVRLMLKRGKVLRVTIEDEEIETHGKVEHSDQNAGSSDS